MIVTDAQVWVEEMPWVPKWGLCFGAAHVPLFLYPFLNTTSKTRPFEYLRLTSLGVIGALVKVPTPPLPHPTHTHTNTYIHNVQADWTALMSRMCILRRLTNRYLTGEGCGLHAVSEIVCIEDIHCSYLP